jgi:lipopolysaccharide/colanic/teichoic acid biosynthesis glycosyltransferase
MKDANYASSDLYSDNYQNASNIFNEVKFLDSIFTYESAKRIIDLLLSLIMIVLLSPLMAICALMIMATSKGPAFYTQKRIGFRGKIFNIYKFRSMVNGADQLEKHLSRELYEYYQKNRKITNDPRITKFGRILRRTSIDELPQLFNILKGEMTFVGPRPLLLDEINMYGENYDLYLSHKPGLTGLWQIKSRHISSMSERAKLDAEYIRNCGLKTDLFIILRTVVVVFSRKGAC